MGHFAIVWYLADHGANLSRSHDHLHTGLLLSAVRHRSVEALGKLTSNPRLIMEPMDVPAAPRHAAWAQTQGLAQ